jgi:hypothetical protein
MKAQSFIQLTYLDEMEKLIGWLEKTDKKVQNSIQQIPRFNLTKFPPISP